MQDIEFYRYQASDNFNVNDLALGVESIMSGANCITQIKNLDNGDIIVQCKNDNENPTLKLLSGTQRALTVQLSVKDNELQVQIGNAKWEDKVVGYALGLVFFPLLITATYGVVKQSEMKREILDYIDRYIK